MKIKFQLLLFLMIISFSFSTQVFAQAYTRGGYSQLYWDWRPDIADSCYEFTYVKYVPQTNVNDAYSPMVNIFYWDDCNYGINYINADPIANTYSNEPFHDTLFRTTLSPYGVKDTMCGFPAAGSRINFAQMSTPMRTKVTYKGLVFLPEKCANWHFLIAPYGMIPGPNFPEGDFIYVYCNKYLEEPPLFAPYNNVLSNLDSVITFTYSNSPLPAGSAYLRMYAYGIMNNADFPDNSSLRFLADPFLTYQVQHEVEINPCPFDPDHDSISIRIADTISSNMGAESVYGWSLQYFAKYDLFGFLLNERPRYNLRYYPLLGSTISNPPRYNASNPFNTDSTFQLVDSTGKTTFIAQEPAEPVLMYVGKDYREGKVASETFMINQFTVLADGRLPSYMKIDTASLQNSNFNSQGTILACPTLPISFDSYIKLPGGSSGNLIVSTTADTTIPGNGTCIINGLHTDSVHLTFSWTPPIGTHGLYNVFVFAKDSNCSPPYHQYQQIYTWSFYIDSCSSLNTLDLEMSKDFEVYPNPVTSKLSIESDKHFTQVRILNLQSAILLDKHFESTKKMVIDLEDLKPGLYILEIDGQYRKKVFVK